MATFPSASSSALDATAAPRVEITELFDQHAPALYRFAAAMLRDPDAAQDVVQDSFVKLINHLAAGGALANARGWLYTVVAHGCRDRQRRQWRWLPWAAELDARPSPDAADRFAGRELLLAALSRLRSRDRLLVLLRAEGLSYAEMASAAAVEPTSVGRFIARALDRLAHELSVLQELPR